jgi:hypothetical protein
MVPEGCAVPDPWPHEGDIALLHRVWLTVAVWAVMIALWVILTFPTASRTDDERAAHSGD